MVNLFFFSFGGRGGGSWKKKVFVVVSDEQCSQSLRIFSNTWIIFTRVKILGCKVSNKGESIKS